MDIRPAKKLSWSSVRFTSLMLQSPDVDAAVSREVDLEGRKEPSGRRSYPDAPWGRMPRLRLYCSSISYAVGAGNDAAGGGGAAGGDVAVGDELAEAVDRVVMTVATTERTVTMRWRWWLAMVCAWEFYATMGLR